MAANIRENKTKQYQNLSDMEPEPIDVPMDIILYFTKFLKFEDYRNFTRTIWPDGDESGIIGEKLWQMSTHTLEALFFNGKRLKVVYNVDAAREKAG